MIIKINKPEIENPLNKKILIITAKWYEDMEVWYTLLRLSEAGADVTVAAPEIIEYTGYYGLKMTPHMKISEVKSNNFDALIIPGGYAPDFLRRDESILAIVREFHEQGKLIAFICHGGWVPISAKIIKGRRATGLIAIKDDMINAGALWEDKPVVVDGNFISSRRPDDLPCFCNEIITYLTNH